MKLSNIYNASINTKLSALKYHIAAKAIFPVSIKSTKYSYNITEIRYHLLIDQLKYLCIEEFYFVDKILYIDIIHSFLTIFFFIKQYTCE